MGATPKLVSRLDPRIRREWLKQTKGDARAVDAIIDFLKSRPFIAPEPEGDNHHMLWRARYPRYKKCLWNIIKLTREDHISVHALMVSALPMDLGLRYALKATMMKRSCGWAPKDSGELRNLYLSKWWSTGQLGKKYGVSRSAIYSFLQRNGILLHRPGEAHQWRPKNPDQVKKLYLGGWSPQKIGEKYGVTGGPVLSFLRRNGIAIRGSKEVHHWRPTNPEQVQKLYLDGSSTLKIGKKYGVSSGTVLSFLRRKSVVLHDAGKQWNPRSLEQVKKLYLGGRAAWRIGKKYGVSPTTITSLLRKSEIAVRNIGEALRWSPKNPEQVKRLYLNGWSVQRIGKKYGKSAHVVRSFLRRNGIKIRGCQWIPPESPKQVRRLYCIGWSANAIAKKYGVSNVPILHFLRREGIHIRNRKEAAKFRNSSVKGESQ